MHRRRHARFIRRRRRASLPRRRLPSTRSPTYLTEIGANIVLVGEDRLMPVLSFDPMFPGQREPKNNATFGAMYCFKQDIQYFHR